MVFVEIKQTRNVFNLMDCGLNEYAIQLKKKAGIVWDLILKNKGQNWFVRDSI